MMEKELFSNYSIDEKTLREYGFRADGGTLIYTQDLPQEHLRIIITCDRSLTGKIMDLDFGGEYVNFRMDTSAGYSAGIRQKFEDLLLDIRDKCCTNQHFQSEQARRISKFIYETFDVMPEFLWPSIPTYAAFRRKKGGKWFAVIGSVARGKVDSRSHSGEAVEVINVKVSGDGIQTLLARDGIYPAFHMNKKCWVSIILDETLTDAEIQRMVRDSLDRV